MTLRDSGDLCTRNVVRMQLFLTFCEDTLLFIYFCGDPFFFVGFTSFKTAPSSRGVFKIPRMSGLSFREVSFCLLYPII